MLAKILHHDSVYCSPVFAVSLKPTRNKMVVFDPSYTRLIVMEIFHNSRYNVLFLDHDTDGFAIDESGFQSYWNDRNIFNRIKRKRYTPEMLAEAKEVLHRAVPRDFTEIQKPSDLMALSIDSGTFHDGYILGMHEEAGILEILLDTSWGSFIILRCKEILENTLVRGEVFSFCDMRIGDVCVEFSFDPMSGAEEKMLKAKSVAFKPMFERKIPLKDFAYSVSDNNFAVKSGSGWVNIDPAKNEILDFRQRKILGYIENDEIMQRCNLFGKEIVYSFSCYVNNPKTAQKTATMVKAFQVACAEYGFSFEDYPAYDDFEEYAYDYGNLLYTHTYGNGYPLLFMLQCLLPVLLLNNGIWVAVRLFNPQMDWLIYFVMGLGVSLAVLVLALVSYLIGFIRDKRTGDQQAKCLEIYENGVKYRGCNASFCADYANIIRVEYKNRIIVQTSWSRFKLHRFKDDKAACELLQKQLNRTK